MKVSAEVVKGNVQHVMKITMLVDLQMNYIDV